MALIYFQWNNFKYDISLLFLTEVWYKSYLTEKHLNQFFNYKKYYNQNILRKYFVTKFQGKINWFKHDSILIKVIFIIVIIK